MKAFIYWGFFLSCCLNAQAKVARVLYYHTQQAAPSPIYMYVNNQLLREVDATFEFSEDLELGANDEDIQIVFSPSRVAEGEALAASLPSVSVNTDWEKSLILVVETAGNEVLPIEAIALNADDHYFGDGDFLFINLSPNSMIGTFGEEPIRVAARSIHVAEMSDFSGEFLDVKLDYIRPDDAGKRRWMIQQGWRVLPDRRTVVLCYVPAGRTSMKYFAVQIKDM